MLVYLQPRAGAGAGADATTTGADAVITSNLSAHAHKSRAMDCLYAYLTLPSSLAEMPPAEHPDPTLHDRARPAR